MYLPFDQLPNTSRIWVYTSTRTLENFEVMSIEKKLTAFAEAWTSHQKEVRASFQILENQFLIIAADDVYNELSGCGIDKSLHVVKELENDLGVMLTEKSWLVFDKDGKKKTHPLSKIKEAITTGELGPDVIYLNTLVTNIGELKSNFRIPIKNSWLKKYLSVPV